MLDDPTAGERRDEIRRWVADDCGYELGAGCDEIRPAHRFDVSCRGTVGPAIQAFLESSDFEHGVRLAISLGGDSDTLACITASVGEAYYGGVPAPIAARAWAFLDPHLRGVVRRFLQVTGRELPLACD